MSKRAETEAFIMTYLTKITGNDRNAKIYEQFFATLDDKAFDGWIDKLEKEEVSLVIHVPNFSDVKITTANNLKVAEELGHDFFQQLWIGPRDDAPAYLTPVKYMVIDLPLRRASQLLTKKISVAEHDRTVDLYTNQPAGDSKTSKISYPELQMLASMGLDQSLTELVKYRGGDKKGFNALNAMINRYGTVNQRTLKNYAGGVESTRTYNTFLTCMHIKSNL